MGKIYANGFDLAVIASPMHMAGLPGPLVNLAGRFQVNYSAEHILKDKIVPKDKRGIFIPVGGGDGSPKQAISLAKYMFSEMGVTLTDDDMILSLNTNNLPAKEDTAALAKIQEISKGLQERTGCETK